MNISWEELEPPRYGPKCTQNDPVSRLSKLVTFAVLFRTLLPLLPCPAVEFTALFHRRKLFSLQPCRIDCAAVLCALLDSSRRMQEVHLGLPPVLSMAHGFMVTSDHHPSAYSVCDAATTNHMHPAGCASWKSCLVK